MSSVSWLGAALPPLDWTLAELTGVWAEQGEMISCPLPGHDDSSPSFNMWDPDEDGVPQQYGCFGCGRRGRVIDLIMEVEGVDEAGAYTRAAELADKESSEQYERKKQPKPKKVPRRPLADTYRLILEAMDVREFAALHEFMKLKGLRGEALESYAQEEWGWASSGDWITMPHYALGKEMTGIKQRHKNGEGKRRRNVEPSEFPALYGTWRDKRKPRVLLCEGETDTVWAAWSMRDSDDVDVLGLPSGAGQFVSREWLDVLKDREVVVAFDADDSGFKAAARWCDARPGTLVARLPEGEDLLSCGIPVAEVMDRATEPLSHSGMVDVTDGVFVRHTQQGDAPVGDFSFTPVRELITEEGPAWEGTISGRRDVSLIRASDLQTATSVTRWANKHGRSWTGSSPAAQGVFNYLASHSAFLPLEMASTKAGKIGRSYVAPGVCIGADRIRYIAPGFGDAGLENKIRLEEAPWDPFALVMLERMNDQSTMAIILGWLCATLIRGMRAPAPPLFISGESGAGKTNLLATLLSSFGFSTETNLTTTTPFGVDSMVSSCVGFPVWFDEYRGGARVDSMERLRQLLRDAYYGQTSMKGGMKTQATELTEVTTWAGIVVSGEMSSYETSHRDRIVMLDLDPDKRGKDEYRWLQEKERTRGLGHALLTFLANRPASLFKVEPLGSEDLPDRFRDTQGFVQAGWDAWLEFRWANGVQEDVKGPDFTLLSQSRKEHEDPWLEAIRACEGVYDRNNIGIVEQREDGVVILPQEVVVEARRVGIELPARANELVQWLKRRYRVTDVRVGTRRAKFVEGMKL